MAPKRKRDNDDAELPRPTSAFNFECHNFFLSDQDGVDALRRLFGPNGPMRIRTHNLVISSQHHIDTLVQAGVTQTSLSIAIKQDEPAVDMELADAPDVAALSGANVETNGNIGGARDEEGDHANNPNGDDTISSSIGYNGDRVVTPPLNGVPHVLTTIDETQADSDEELVIVSERTVQVANGGLSKKTEQLATAPLPGYGRNRLHSGYGIGIHGAYNLPAVKLENVESIGADVVAKIDVTSFFGYGKNRLKLEGTTSQSARNFNNTGLVLLCIHCGAAFSSVSTISKHRKAEHPGCDDKPLKQCYSKRCAFQLPREYVDGDKRFHWNQSACLRGYIAELQGGKNDK